VAWALGGGAAHVILVLNDKGARKLMNGKAKLSADASSAAGGANEDLYGKKASREEIWAGKVQAPDSAKEMLATLTAKSPKNLSAGKQ
jgi:hypothetical protein